MGKNGWTGAVGCESSDCGSQVVNGRRFVGIAVDTGSQSSQSEN